MPELQDHLLRSGGNIMKQKKKWAFAAKMWKKRVTNHAKDCSREKKQGLYALAVAWHGMAHLPVH